MVFNYKKVCQELLKDLRPRTKEVISRRFCLEKSEKKETLESIGKKFGITRERVRQIEEDGFFRIKRKTKQHQNVFGYFIDELKKTGNFRKEDSLLCSLAGPKFRNHVFFLLTLGEPFQRLGETKEFHSLWTTDFKSFDSVRQVLNSFCGQLKERGQPLSLDDFGSFIDSASFGLMPYYLEISKTIQQGPEGLFGLKDWPEISPRGVKDWAYLTLKREKRPLHFTEVTKLINCFYPVKQDTLPQTVHNELIKDQRFVLVGRGIYALKDWGYESGVVKEIIEKLLERAAQPLSREELVKEVLKQRFVKESTILLNLNDKERFVKDEDGKYALKNV